MVNQDLLAGAIRSATAEVFTMMLEMDASPAALTDEHGSEPVEDGLVAMLGLTGSWAGSGTLHCSPKLAAFVWAKMFMAEPCEPPAIDNEVLDAVAELTNMIIGNAKTILEESLGPMGMSIPTVIYGRNFTVRSGGQTQDVWMPFTAGEHRFVVHIGLAENPEERPMLRPRLSALTLH